MSRVKCVKRVKTGGPAAKTPAPRITRSLEFLFAHQLQPKYVHEHQWSEGDLMMWDNIGTLHNAVADYGPEQHRLMRRCQVAGAA